MLNPSPMNGRIFEMPLGCVDYLILNEVEAAQILEADTPALGDEKAALGDEKTALGGEKAGEAMAELLKKKFPRSRIVLTLGEKGAVYCGEETRIRQLHMQSGHGYYGGRRYIYRLFYRGNQSGNVCGRGPGHSITGRSHSRDKTRSRSVHPCVGAGAGLESYACCCTSHSLK